MDTIPEKVVEIIRRKFDAKDGVVTIPLQRGNKSFKAWLAENGSGVEVTNLRRQKFLPWSVFQEAICVLIRNGRRAKRGNPQGARLGEPDLPIDSVEGHIALVVYGKKPGDSVFRRIVPITAILVWAGICAHAEGELVLGELT